MDMGHRVGTGLLTSVIKSKFFTTTRKPPHNTDLTDQVAIITGANSGLGFQCARHLLSLKLSHLIIAVRTLSKGEAAAKRLSTEHPGSKISVWELEMTSYPSIQAFVERVKTTLPRLDFTILNSGMMSNNFEISPTTGHERVVQVNYLSTFLLAILLLPVAAAKAPKTGGEQPGRLTIVSSGTAAWAKFANRDSRPLLASFDDVDATPWDATERYFVSKMLGHLFFVRLLEYLDPKKVVVNLVEPGMTKGTDLNRDAEGLGGKMFAVFKGLMGRTVEDAAWTYVDAAVVKGKETHGCFLNDWEVYP